MNRTIDFSNYKFRCSSLPKLMTKSRSKSDPLSETAKSYLREVWIKEVFDREKLDTSNKYTVKGVVVETDSLELVQRVTGEVYFKNQEQLENEWITGTPDVSKPKLIDIKSSWDIFTFMAVDEKKAYKDYYYQLLGYMWLTDSDDGDLIYALTNTPEDMIMDELYRLSFKYGDSDEFTKQARKNFEYDDIPDERRIKRYNFLRNSADIDDVKTIINLSRKYMETLSL